MRVVSALAASVAIFAVASAAAFPATAASSLEGQNLRNTGVAPVTEFSCGAAGARIVFTASGDAVEPSPYPGTWEESVVLTAGPLTPSGPFTFFGALDSFQSTFAIQSGETVITGTKSLSGGGMIDFVCTRRPGPDDCDELDFSATGMLESLSYSATIIGPTGILADQGTADFHADAFGSDCFGSLSMFGSMLESFVRSLTVDYDDVCALAVEYSTDAAVADSICKQLAAAEAADRRGAIDVKDSIIRASARLVEAQAGKSLTREQADELLSLLAQLEGS
jgi:hypothetical protein